MPVRFPNRKAFTLVELLVVTGIIALLISMLLSALSRARGAAQTITCAANLRSLLQAMQIYASNNSGYLPGGPNTSGKFLLDSNGTSGYSNANVPSVISMWDWMSPLASSMGIPFNEDPSAQQERCWQLMNFKGFRCPANDIPTVANPVNGTQVLPMVSYSTAAMFLLVNDNGVASYFRGRTVTPNVAWYNISDEYAPKFGSVHPPAAKVCMAESGGWSDGEQSPDTDLQFDDPLGAVSFTDPGPWYKYSRCWLRSNAPYNISETTDSRIYAFRHGKLDPNGVADSFRFNVGFFDGHVQTMGDLEGSDPNLWMPTGSFAALSEIQSDVAARYNVTGNFIAN